METEILETVLKDVLDEQKSSNQLTKDLDSHLKVLAEKVEGFSQKLDSQKVIAPPADTNMVQAVVARGITKMQQLVEAQPKNVIKQFRLLLFPERDAWNYYKLALGRVVFWLAMILIATYSFVIGKSYFDKIAMNAENDRCRKAWTNLYWSAKKSQQAKMDSVWNNTY